VKRLVVIANPSKPQAGRVVARIADVARKLDVHLVADRETARLLPGLCPVSLSELPRSIDAVIACGGDGTVLRTARELAGRDCPVMGVNLGGLGFLTSVTESDVEQALEELVEDRCVVTERSLAEITVRRGKRIVATERALNEVVIGRLTSSRVLTLEAWIEQESVTSYRCDGLIVATPTGSTGHSLSAGGPILTPEVHAFVLTLICPHTLTWRPVVVPDDRAITVRIMTDVAQQVTVDGQVNHPLRIGDAVCIRRSARGIRFLHRPDYSHFAVLRQKLQWAGSVVQDAARKSPRNKSHQ